MLQQVATLVALLVLAVTTKSTAQGLPDEVRCNYTRQAVCDSEGCREMELGSSFLVIPALPDLLRPSHQERSAPQLQIRRCDDTGCTPATVRAAASGVFVNVWKADGGYMLKVASETQEPAVIHRGDFVDVATLMLTSIVSHGRCEL